jgi:outer membrane protein assembly factor BamD
MKQAMKDLEDEYYVEAVEIFQKIKDRYPYSKFVIPAELKMADAFYMRGQYDEAYEAYREFERLHPRNKNIPYVIYQKGMCHYSRVDTVDRDQYHTFLAKEEFERLVKRFPNSEYAKKVFWNIRRCYVNLAENELYVGNFYFNRGKYRAAMARYRYLLRNYPDLGQYHDALEYLGRCEVILAQKGVESHLAKAELLQEEESHICHPCERIRHGRPKALEREIDESP